MASVPTKQAEGHVVDVDDVEDKLSKTPLLPNRFVWTLHAQGPWPPCSTGTGNVGDGIEVNHRRYLPR